MTNEPNISAADERWLDRLVDGELDEAQRRQLLLELDSQPEGWRRCALAFLEAQAWRRSLSALAAKPRGEVESPPSKPAAVVSWWSSSWGTVLAAAASFLIAFGLGQVWRDQAVGPERVAVKQPAPPAQPASPRAPQEQPQWSTMTVAVDRDADGVAEPLELPIAKGPGIDEAWLRNQPASIPPHVLRALERMGHQVRQQREYYPFELEDGRRVVVPVDELDVHYVRERHFQ